MSKRATVLIGAIAILAVLTGTALAMRSTGLGSRFFGQSAEQSAKGPLDGGGAVLLAKLAALMGSNPAELQGLMAEQTPAEIAASKGIDRATLRAAAVDAIRTMLNNRVREGVIVAADVEPMLALAEPKIDAWLDHNEKMAETFMGPNHKKGDHGSGNHEPVGGKMPAWGGWGEIQPPGK